MPSHPQRKYAREQLDQPSNASDANHTASSPVKRGTAGTVAAAPVAAPTGDLSASTEDIDVGTDVFVVPRPPSATTTVSAAAAAAAASGASSDRRDYLLPGGRIIGLDAAVLKSIERCGSDELKRKMYGSVLVVGGGMRFAGAGKWLAGRLALQTPYMFRTVDGAAGSAASAATDVVTFGAKDGEPVATAWRGAAIMVGLESAPELFIEAAEWKKLGVRVLRERAPFMW